MASTRRLAAILAADVAGYSRLMGADEEGTHERLKAHLSELVDPKIEEHRGRVGEVAGLRRPDVLEPIEVADDLRGNRGGALPRLDVEESCGRRLGTREIRDAAVRRKRKACHALSGKPVPNPLPRSPLVGEAPGHG